MTDDFDESSFSKNVNMRQLALMANRLVRIMDDTWSTYVSLFDLMDMDDVANNERATEAILELEAELSSILDAVRSQLKMLKMVSEPLPKDKVDDFEQAVLTTLANLDNVDLEQFRIVRNEEDALGDDDE